MHGEFPTPCEMAMAFCKTCRPMTGESPVPGILARATAEGLEAVHIGPAWPNGIGSAADGSGAIYLADFATGTVLKILPDRRAEALATLAEGHADGLAVDSTGRIWVATGPGATLVALTPRGSVDRRVHLPVGFVSSVALGLGGAGALVAVGGRADGTGGILQMDLGVEGVSMRAGNAAARPRLEALVAIASARTIINPIH